MASLNLVRDSLNALLEEYAEARGIGGDAYWPEDAVHPMADAKYVLAIVQFYRAELITQSKAMALCKPVVARLKDQAVPLYGAEGPMLGWGLGFPWEKHNYTAVDALLINTSIAAHALASLRDNELMPSGFESFFQSACDGIQWWGESAVANPPALSGPNPRSTDGPALPVYGLSNYREPVHNTAAYCLAALIRLGVGDSEDFRSKLDYVASQYVSGAGWVYSHDNAVIDLLHQWYILNSLFDGLGAANFQDHARSVYGQFATDTGFLDTALLLPPSWQLDNSEYLGTVLLRPVGTGTLAVKPKAARLWSVGEMLVGLSRLCEANPDDPLWPRYALSCAKLILNSFQERQSEEWSYPRHTMHAAHGLAAYLSLRRGRPVL